MEPPKAEVTEDIEVGLLLEAVYRRWGCDFRDYAMSSLKRRLKELLRSEGLDSFSALQERVLRDPACLERMLLALSVRVTAMFRDPDFYRALRDQVIPVLRTYPFIRIWVAGCATGEEAYSLAILLEEEGAYEKTRLYATDMNECVLRRAAAAIIPLSAMQGYTSNYIRAGGRGSFSEWYAADAENAILRKGLLRNTVFAPHNLATDASFNEFNLVLCRNVMIYFNETLQARVHQLLYESLAMFGVLGLGDRETLRFSPCESCYEVLDRDHKLYRKVR